MCVANRSLDAKFSVHIGVARRDAVAETEFMGGLYFKKDVAYNLYHALKKIKEKDFDGVTKEEYDAYYSEISMQSEFCYYEPELARG